MRDRGNREIREIEISEIGDSCKHSYAMLSQGNAPKLCACISLCSRDCFPDIHDPCICVRLDFRKMQYCMCFTTTYDK